MFLNELELHNFKSFENIKIDFDEHLTVIVGANGAGKTSIMEGAAIAISAMFVKMDGLVARGIDKSQVRLAAYNTGSSKDVQAQYPARVSASMRTMDRELKWERDLNSSNGKNTIIDAKDIINFGLELQTGLRKGDKDLILPIIAYYGTGRIWDYHREKQNNVFESNNRLNGYIDCVDGTANIKLMMNWFEKMTIQKYQNQELNLGGIPELEAVISAMEECYKRITKNDAVKVQYSLATKELEVVYVDEKGDLMRIPISQLSDGYKSTVSLVADIAYRMAVLNPHLLHNVCSETDGIVIIDEVDLHLHPAWQQRILSDLTAIFPNVQFIVSTHAPAVINTTKSDNIIIIDQGQVYAPSGEVHGKDINTIVSGLMKASERPMYISELFKRFYDCIDKNNITEAEHMLDELKSYIGNDDAEISACNIKLAFLKARRQQ